MSKIDHYNNQTWYEQRMKDLDALGAPPQLDDLSDVTITSAAAYEILIRNAGNTYWENSSKIRVKDSTPTIYSDSNGGTANDLTVACGTEKTLVLANTVTTDVYPSSVSVGVGGTAPNFTAYSGNLKAYEFTGGVSNKELQIGWQLSHTYAEGTAISPHLHLYFVSGAADAGKTIIFDLEYDWANVDDTGSIVTTTLTGTHTIAANNTTYRNTIFSFTGAGSGTGNNTPVTGTGKKISSVFMTRLVRRQDLDDFGSSVWLKSADIHIYQDTLGSRQVLVK